MAEKENKNKMTYGQDYKYKSDYESDLEVHDNYIADFDAYEAMLIGEVYDTVSKSVNKSAITDSYTATLAIERAARVMGKLPDGVTVAAAKSDQSRAALLDIIRQKWIYPNANSQRPFFNKLRLWQLYSTVYGYMPMFYDWNVNKNTGHVGPDCWLWNPRNLIPQQGRTSLEDMDYVTALSWVTERTIRGWLDEPDSSGWDKKVLKEMLDKARDVETEAGDSDRDTHVDRKRNVGGTKKGICIATRYEAGKDGRWVVFAPDHSCKVLRDIPNPHKNGKIPFVIKYSQELFDSFYGMGDFQRAKPLQFARDGLTNFYFQGIKMNLIPPMVVNANGVLKHTLDYRPGGVIMETINNSVRRLETSTAGLSTYQAAQSQLTGSLLSLYGSQNASMPGAETLNPSQGKTPAAISLYTDKEATRDGQERALLESAIEQLTDGFYSLIGNVGTEKMLVTMFAADIEEMIKQGFQDLTQFIQPGMDGMAGSMAISPDLFGKGDFRFNINFGTTAEENKQKQREELDAFMANLAKFQNILKEDPRIKINWGEMQKAYVALTGIKNADSFISVMSDEEYQAMVQQQQEQEALTQARAQEQARMEMAQQQQQALAPAATSIRGTLIRDPDVAAAAQAVDNL